jgi:2'-5' RNA ligase
MTNESHAMTNASDAQPPVLDKASFPLRLFVALLLPDEVVGALAALSERLRKGMQFAGCRARWVPAENMHLTLAFLGDQPADRVAALESIIDGLADRFAPLRLEAKDIGAFPHWQRPSVLWAGLRDRSGGDLDRLHAALHAALAPLGYRAQDKAFRPHVTLARLASQRSAPAMEKLAHDHAGFRAGSFAADRLALMLSRLGPGGARHEPLATRVFRGIVQSPTDSGPVLERKARPDAPPQGR